PKTIVAYNETCDLPGIYTQKTYIVDWRPGFEARVVLLEKPVVFSPSWSPDGKQLAFTVLTNDVDYDIANPKLDFDVVVRDLDSGQSRTVAAISPPMPPTWSPNGHSIVFFPNGPISVYDTLTGQVRSFPLYGGSYVYPNAWS